jgi:alpha-galactosidase/6-phospho-beta-glucosidase family protein
MPAEAIVELPVLVGRDGFQPLEPPSAPPDVQAMLRTNAAFEMLWVEAVVERSYDKALRAMALNHLVRDLDQARAILEEIWK